MTDKGLIENYEYECSFIGNSVEANAFLTSKMNKISVVDSWEDCGIITIRYNYIKS